MKIKYQMKPVEELGMFRVPTLDTIQEGDYIQLLDDNGGLTSDAIYKVKEPNYQLDKTYFFWKDSCSAPSNAWEKDKVRFLSTAEAEKLLKEGYRLID